MTTLEELLALRAIETLKARYCRLLDGKDWTGFEALFAPDAVLDVQQDTGLPPIHGRAAIVAQVRAAVDHAATSHQVHAPEISLLAPDMAEGVWAMQDRVVWRPGLSPLPGVASLTGYGQYHERYRRAPDGWRLAAIRLTRFHVDLHPG